MNGVNGVNEVNIDAVWENRCNLVREGIKARERGYKSLSDSERLDTGGSRLKLESIGYRTRRDGEIMITNSISMWSEAVEKIQGDSEMEWKSEYHCVLNNGMECKHND